MEIVVLQGSPNLKGSTNLLVESFTKGAQEAGHVVTRFDVCAMNVHACLGCVACGFEGPCAQSDDVGIIRKALLSADMVVFATPLYYYGMTAQLKNVVDRFAAYNTSLNQKHLKAACLAVGGGTDDWTFDALDSHFKTLVRYIEMENVGTVYGFGCDVPETTAASDYPKQAYELGKNL